MLGGRKVRLAGMSASIMRGLEVDPVRGHLLALQAARIVWGLKCGLTGEWQGSGAAAGNLRLPTIRAPSTFQYPPRWGPLRQAGDFSVAGWSADSQSLP